MKNAQNLAKQMTVYEAIQTLIESGTLKNNRDFFIVIQAAIKDGSITKRERQELIQMWQSQNENNSI